MTTPLLQLTSVTFDTDDPGSLAAFWAAAAGGEPTGTDEDVFLQTDAANIRFHFQRPSTHTTDQQNMHLDFRVPWGDMEAEVSRLISLGATLRRETLDEHPGMRLASLADPENNRFCVVEIRPH